jgi:hypothetical protein
MKMILNIIYRVMLSGIVIEHERAERPEAAGRSK